MQSNTAFGISFFQLTIVILRLTQIRLRTLVAKSQQAQCALMVATKSTRERLYESNNAHRML